MPSARSAGAVEHAGDLARQVDCALIVLASRAAVGAEILETLAPLKLRQLFVVDVPEKIAKLPVFETSGILRRENMARSTDVSAKRNVGLAVARMAGLHRVLFLDDDMRIPEAESLKVAAGLLRSHDAVGLKLEGFPDNSVVCHANRETGGFQDTFVGGGALLAATEREMSFFPDVYNEDWFFLLNRSRLRPVTVAGRAEQDAYDPFATEERARLEEFGDVMAEGIFAILDDAGELGEADREYWRGFLDRRLELIERTQLRINLVRRADRKKVARSLRAARDQLTSRITPELCVEYLHAWQRDLANWIDVCDRLEKKRTVEEALGYFGLTCAEPAKADCFASV
ncbi:hypothetical protein GCM10009557_11780 [Virgisporangium ochraceum]